MNLIDDIKFEITKLKEDKSTLRKFAITIASALCIIGALVFFLGSRAETAFWLWGFGSSILILGITVPNVLKPFHLLWMTLAFVLGWFVSRLILSIVFYLVMTPIGLVMKIIGKDLINQKLEKNNLSYWIKRDPVNRNPESYEKLF